MLLATDYPFLDIFWTMLILCGLVIWLFLIFMVVLDNFRRNDHSGWAKAAWTLGIIIFPLFGVLVYMIARPAMTEQDREMLEHYRNQQQRQSGSSADELAKLAKLRDDGAISPEDYETLKRRAIAG